ncbi:PIG-L deacetylase family protein [Chloroflexota bacterium]
MSDNFYVPKRVMAIMAHPDDPEFSCSGTVARWAKAGAKICYVLCTSGDVGIAKPGMTRLEAAKIREAEQREACRITGVDEIVFIGEPDGMLVATLELRKKLVREIRRFRPEVVITGDPTRVWSGDSYINHPDHRAASAAALDAVFPAAGQPNLFEDIAKEGFQAHKPRKVYVTHWEEADVYINIEETIDTKIEALRAHKSQMRDWDPEPRIKEWAASRGKGKEMAYAESFRVITLVSDDDWETQEGCVLDCEDED